MILKLAGDVIGDKGFIGTDYIITPVRKPTNRDLYMREHDYNNQISSLRAPIERAVANLKTWRILFTDYRRPLKTFLSSYSQRRIDASVTPCFARYLWSDSILSGSIADFADFFFGTTGSGKLTVTSLPA